MIYRIIGTASLVLTLFAPAPASAQNANIHTTACMGLWSKVRQAEPLVPEARDIQSLIAPLVKGCATEITNTLSDAPLSTHQDQLRALDTISFYFNATSQTSPFPLEDLAAKISARFPPGTMDAASSESLRAIKEENRSVGWLEEMNLGRSINKLQRKKTTPTDVIVLKLDNGRLKADQLDLSKVDLVVVAGCHMARRAARQLLQDPAAMLLLSDLRVVWMQPVDRSLNVEDVAKWNQDFPEAPMHIAFENSQWRGMDLTALPTFHLLRNGKVVASHRGWSRDGSTPAALLEALENLQAR